VIVGAHQPHYLPWLGYLHKVASTDVFVVMDDLQYEAQNFQNRNRVKVNNGAVWLTVPLQRGAQSDFILEKLVDNSVEGKQNWQRRSWETLRTHYGRAPYFRTYADELEALYTRRWERLVDLDLHVLELMMRWFDIRRPLVRSSSLGLRGQKTTRIVDLCKKLGADTYLSGGGGSRGYLQVDELADADVLVLWQSFTHPVYSQRYPDAGFVSHLAALDLLFNCGPASRRMLLGDGGEVAREQAVR
jgi:hypothetical protein